MALGLPTEGAGASRPRPRSGPFPRGGASELLLRGVDGAGVPGIQAYGAAPFEDLQVDLTEMPQCGDLIPRFGLRLRIGSDKRPGFVADLVQKTAKVTQCGSRTRT
ncbi:uncharacterized protein LOC106996962 isoform X3 [Macaca mulatta]